jgi:hypothetical protein
MTSDTLEAATLAASVLLRQYLTPFDRRWHCLPSPTLYEDVAAEEGESVQLIIASNKSPEKASKGGCLLKIVLCFVVVLLLWTLAAMSSHTCASAPSEAANIVSELRNLKAATMMYYADHIDTFSSLSGSENHLALLLPYTDKPEKEWWNSFAFRVVNGIRWVGYKLDKKSSQETSERLENRAKSTGLLGSPSIDEPPASTSAEHLYKKTDGAVWLFIDAPSKNL